MRTRPTNKLTPPRRRGLSTHLHNTSYCTNICFSLRMRSSDLDNSLLHGSIKQPWRAWRKTTASQRHCTSWCEEKQKPLSKSWKREMALPSSLMVKGKITYFGIFLCHLCSCWLIYLQYIYKYYVINKTSHREGVTIFSIYHFNWLLVLLFQPVNLTTQSSTDTNLFIQSKTYNVKLYSWSPFAVLTST